MAEFAYNKKSLKHLGDAIRYLIKENIKSYPNITENTNLELIITNVANCKSFFGYVNELNMISSVVNGRDLRLNLGKILEKDIDNNIKKTVLDITRWLGRSSENSIFNLVDTLPHKKDSFFKTDCICNKYVIKIKNLEPYLPQEINESLQWHFLPEYKKMRLFNRMLESENKIKNLNEQVEMLTKMVNKLSNQDSILKQMERARNQLSSEHQ